MNGNPRELPDGRRWNGLAYVHDAPVAGCNCASCSYKPSEFEAWLRTAGRVTVTEEGEQLTLDGRTERMYRLFNSAGESRLVAAETAESYGYRPNVKQKPLRAPQTSLFGESGFMFAEEG